MDHRDHTASVIELWWSFSTNKPMLMELHTQLNCVYPAVLTSSSVVNTILTFGLITILNDHAVDPMV